MPETVERTIRVTTKQRILEDKPPAAEGFPIRKWSIQLSILGGDDGAQELKANVFDRVTYKLHPTFQNPNRVLKRPPFLIEEEGWGEFDLAIVMHFADKGGEKTVSHDLNFREAEYTVDHVVQFPTNRPNLSRLLAESGPVPGYNAPGVSGTLQGAAAMDHGVSSVGGAVTSGINGGAAAGTGLGGMGVSPGMSGDAASAAAGAKANKKRKVAIEKGNVDLERLAQGLEKLSEDDLLVIVQMVTDNKTPEMYVKNDVEEGEFHLDLCTLPDRLLRSLWDYVRPRVEV